MVHDASVAVINLLEPVPQHCLTLSSSVPEPEPVEPKLFWDLEPEPKINFNKHFLQSVWRMLQ